MLGSPDGFQTTSEWLTSVRSRGAALLVKRLAANDTGATGAHQAGPYVPRVFIAELFAEVLNRRSEVNPRVTFDVRVASHDAPPADVTLIWYNNRLFGGTRNEFRLTGWGGEHSPLLDPENTGAICVLAFDRSGGRVESCVAWVCSNELEEDAVEAVVGPVEPGQIRLVGQGGKEIAPELPGFSPCDGPLPASWKSTFPEARLLVDEAISRCPTRQGDSDSLLLARRDCEFRLFAAVERGVVLPRVTTGFATVEEFVEYAGQVTNRRKSRAGRSLELHLVRLFERDAVAFAHSPVSEGAKRPDFLFPSVEAYHDKHRADETLRMLAVKTTCKDRWRQVLNEADRVEHKHLFTLQEGVSVQQFTEMTLAGLKLVVPKPLHTRFPAAVRPELLSLGQFISEVSQLR